MSQNSDSKNGKSRYMNRIIIATLMVTMLSGCRGKDDREPRIAVARAGEAILYYDQIPSLVEEGMERSDSIAAIQNYINRWARRELLMGKAEANLSAEVKNEIDSLLKDSRTNLLIYEYQQKMILEKMDTLITEDEIRNYYATNESSFILTSNIVKARIIKLPVSVPDPDRIKALARADGQSENQELEKICFQYAQKYDDFGEEWIPMSRLMLEIPGEIGSQEEFLRRSSFYESSDQASIYLLTIRDYRLRSSVAPYEYVKADIKRTIWNNRRMEFLRSLENGIYNEALKDNSFKMF